MKSSGPGLLGLPQLKNTCTFGHKRSEFAPFKTAKASGQDMKQDIHPEYREVVFQDISSEFAILTRSTVPTRETIKWEDGKEYPLLKLEISSQSHPFYTGKQHILQTAKQVDKFRKRYGK
jgi:large subunit ribosomal protein L31